MGHEMDHPHELAPSGGEIHPLKTIPTIGLSGTLRREPLHYGGIRGGPPGESTFYKSGPITGGFSIIDVPSHQCGGELFSKRLLWAPPPFERGRRQPFLYCRGAPLWGHINIGGAPCGARWGRPHLLVC